MTISKERASLLRELEQIIGSETFNRKTQNYGPKDETGEKIKPKPPYSNLPIDVQMTGRYVMGANELHIMRALDKAIQYLEENHGLKI